jgi:hypothetical protein
MPAADRLSRSRLLPSGRRRWVQAADSQRSIKSVLSYFLLTQLLLIATGRAAELSVSVSGLSNDRGHVVIDVCTRAEFLGPRCAYHGSTPAKPGTVIVNVASVSPGSYAIQAYHDENERHSREFGRQRPRDATETDSPLKGARFEPSVPA